ncbi:shikimate dehydrogenase [Chitinophaga pendula]|uniref:shikimate dehydrogenase family protein n=1 Tax=Chitinophaga TaxID=79328 RepID=UPI000BAFA6DD|nr:MULTISPECIES: shikimate dehydrogenase [Chitinophaga]ASZ11368.1 shikimate dehydrogenase [Chitinophaga sp. MD30]UCJ05628.1 shikimate dehydrogenase [Chitinophaga pendula]
MKVYGLIGYPLGHSFSKGFFADKFAREGISGCVYENFPLADISAFPALLADQPALCGLNVTIPHKEVVIPYLDELSDAARHIGAVNCIKITEGRKTGYNTDVIGFSRSLTPLLQPHHTQALVLGTGGAAKAVLYALQQLSIGYTVVSRQAGNHTIDYTAVDAALLETHTLIINTTPLGMYPKVETAPELPYAALGSRHLLYDLVYNPAMTRFLEYGAAQGAATKNGHEMLVLQAEASWEIWNRQI